MVEKKELMDEKKGFISLKAKIILSTLIPVVAGLLFICIIIFISLFDSLMSAAQSRFVTLSQRYSDSFEKRMNNALNYLSILSSDLETQAAGSVAREDLQIRIFKIFDDYDLVDGSSVYFEPNMYDGLDDYYKGTNYGTAKSGRICWYFYDSDGVTAYLPEAFSDDAEFDSSHYTMAKAENRPIYTDPETHEVDGQTIHMFTVTYPIQDAVGQFIGAVTVDIFLDDLYAELRSEKIYETGYLAICNDDSVVIYSPNYEHIGMSREQAGFEYPLPTAEQTEEFFNSISLVNGKETLVKINMIYIEQLDTSFYISVSAPIEEINAEGVAVLFSLSIVVAVVLIGIALLLNVLIGRLSAPLKEITNNVDRIANGEYGSRIHGDYHGEFGVVKNSVNVMASSIESYINESQNRVDILKNILNGLEAAIYVTDPDTDEVLFMNDRMKSVYDIKGDAVGQVCYKILQEGKTERCSFCPCHQLEKEPDSVVVWEEHSTLVGRDFLNFDRMIDWWGGKKVHLQHSVETTDMKRAQAALDRRLKQQAIMTAVSQSFLSDAPISELIDNALKQTGEFIGVSHIVYYSLDTDGKTFVCQNEWINPDSVSKKSGIGIRQTMPDSFIEYVRTLTGERFMVLSANDPALKDIMQPCAINYENYITAPIFVKGVLFGALDLCKESDAEQWSESDKNFAALISTLLSGVLEKETMEGQLRRLSSVVENSSQFIMSLTADGKVDYANPAVKKITGFTQEELSASGLDLLFDAQAASDIKNKYLPQTFMQGTGNFEINIQTKSGEERNMIFSTFITAGAASSGDVASGIASDVTELRKLQSELISAKELAEQGSRSKSDFLARMSHEMRTPMNAVIGMTSIAKSATDIQKKEYCLERIDNASRHLLGVINDILDMSKIEANKFEIINVEFNFRKMIDRVLNVVVFRIDEKQQNFTLSIDPDVPANVIGDEQRLAQVITNLLSNAVKFTPEGGKIKLLINVISSSGSEVVIQTQVIDSGIGISAEQQTRLFHSFEQADGGISRKYGGTGLGLVISKRIVELMGGTIWVESQAGKGSTFAFDVKVQRGEERAEHESDAKEEDRTFDFSGKHVLLAEDVELNREILATLLKFTNIEIDCAENGIEAVELFVSNPDKYDLIFMDIHMPLMDGLEATRKIRALPHDRAQTIPIVAMTANVFKEDVERCISAGMNDHTGKPIELPNILAVMKKYIS